MCYSVISGSNRIHFYHNYNLFIVYIEYQLSLVPKFAYPVLSTLQYKIIPVYRTIEQFRINNEYEAELYTDPFYTTQGGYKMTLNVYPNGDGPGKGTHISAFICLMKGENDHNLPFPFSGIFTIKLLNWKQDTGHVVKSVVFDETMPLKYRRQVTTGQMANGWGCDFLSHTKLMGESSDHQYLYENKLCFQILFAPINQTGQNHNSEEIQCIEFIVDISSFVIFTVLMLVYFIENYFTYIKIHEYRHHTAHCSRVK